MQPGFQVLYCICKLQINGIAQYYVSGEETSINLNMLVNWFIVGYHVLATAQYMIQAKLSCKQCTVYAIYFAGVLFSRISRVGCYSRIQQHAKINLPPIPTQECNLCMYAILVVQYTMHVQMSEWYWFLRPPSMIALLLDREFNHSRKCLEVPIREKLDSRNIWRIQYLKSIGGQLSFRTEVWCHSNLLAWKPGVINFWQPENLYDHNGS